MNNNLFLHHIISNEPLDMDIFNLLIQKTSSDELYDAAFVQRLSSLVNSDLSSRHQIFLLESIDSILTNYVSNKNKRKESKLGNWDFSFNMLGLCLMNKIVFNLSLEGRVDYELDNINEQIKNNELKIKALLPHYKNKDFCFRIKKHDLKFNILEMGYLTLDQDIISLGQKLNQTIQEANVPHLLKSFIYYDNQVGFQVLKNNYYYKKFLTSKTDEQKFLFILHSIGEIDLSTSKQVQSNLQSQLDYITKIMAELGLSKLNGDLVSTALFDYLGKDNRIDMVLNLPITYQLIDNFMHQHTQGYTYSNNLIFKLSNYPEGLKYLRSKEITFNNTIDEILSKEFRQNQSFYQTFKTVLSLMNVKVPQSMNVFNDISAINFKNFIENLEYDSKMINDEHLCLIFQNLNLNLNSVYSDYHYDTTIQGVSKPMTLGNMAAVMCMNQGYIKSFEALIEKEIKLEAVTGAEASVLDVIAKRKKSGIVYNNIVEKYKLSNIMSQSDETVKKRVKI